MIFRGRIRFAKASHEEWVVFTEFGFDNSAGHSPEDILMQIL